MAGPVMPATKIMFRLQTTNYSIQKEQNINNIRICKKWSRKNKATVIIEKKYIDIFDLIFLNPY